MEIRALQNDDKQKFIEGYFIKYNVDTNLTNDIKERIERGSFTKTLLNDNIRCLFNHNTDEVLGTTRNKTLTLIDDDVGLYGKVLINENDSVALNVYERVKRGDIDGCSFGFNPVQYDYQRDSKTFILREAQLLEVSICSFPQYKQTEIYARAELNKLAQKKSETIAKIKLLKGE